MSRAREFLAKLYRGGGTWLPPGTGDPAASTLDTVEELRGLGYRIEAHPELGYRLVESPDQLIPDDLMARLPEAGEAAIGNQIIVFQATGSTNDIVQRLGLEGHREGVVIFAESQTAGRGRHGRDWLSPPAKGLWFSFLLRPGLSFQAAPRLMVMTAVAVARALRKGTGLPLTIKWPNDILCGGRKLGGILVECSGDGTMIGYAAVGVGINVNLDPAEFPEGLRNRATSLKIEAGQGFDRPALAAAVLTELNRCHPHLCDDGFRLLLEEWVELDDTLGRQVSVQGDGGRMLHGQAVDLDADGALLLRMDDGRVERVTAGDVAFQP